MCNLSIYKVQSGGAAGELLNCWNGERMWNLSIYKVQSGESTQSIPQSPLPICGICGFPIMETPLHIALCLIYSVSISLHGLAPQPAADLKTDIHLKRRFTHRRFGGPLSHKQSRSSSMGRNGPARARLRS